MCLVQRCSFFFFFFGGGGDRRSSCHMLGSGCTVVTCPFGSTLENFKFSCNYCPVGISLSIISFFLLYLRRLFLYSVVLHLFGQYSCHYVSLYFFLCFPGSIYLPFFMSVFLSLSHSLALSLSLYLSLSLSLSLSLFALSCTKSADR